MQFGKKMLVPQWIHFVWVGFVMADFVPAAHIAWFYALDEDKSAFEAIAGPPLRSFDLAGGTQVSDYRVGDHTVSAAKMGSGSLRTAVNVTRVLAQRRADRVISTGPAGALDDSLKVGDWLVCDTVVCWQQGKIDGTNRFVPSLTATHKMEFRMDQWPFAQDFVYRRGAIVASGELFVANSQKRRDMRSEFKADIVEMNAAGLVTAASDSNCEILILRVVSDHADEKADTMFSEFLKEYDGRGGKIVAELIKNLPVSKTEPAAHQNLRELLNNPKKSNGDSSD
jgi:nucleoside phosphorylase